MTDYNPGFTLSGPVIIPFGEGKSIYDGHNRTFFAVSYENDNLRDTTLIDAYVPVLTGRFTLPAATNATPACETNSTTSTCKKWRCNFHRTIFKNNRYSKSKKHFYS